MGMFSIILIVGAVVGALVLLILLYAMCRSCNSQRQRDRDVEARVHILFRILKTKFSWTAELTNFFRNLPPIGIRKIIYPCIRTIAIGCIRRIVVMSCHNPRGGLILTSSLTMSEPSRLTGGQVREGVRRAVYCQRRGALEDDCTRRRYWSTSIQPATLTLMPYNFQRSGTNMPAGSMRLRSIMSSK